MRQCTIGDCRRKHDSLGFCSKHRYYFKQYGDALATGTHSLQHGSTNTPEYSIWCHIKGRCYNMDDPAYKDYGARGIKVCDRWLYSFKNFLKDVGTRPNKDYSIDRIDNDGHYEPNNCRWATLHQQASNRRNNNLIVGVSYDSTTRKYQAQLTVAGKSVIRPRRYATYELAVKARRTAEMLYLGYNVNKG